MSLGTPNLQGPDFTSLLNTKGPDLIQTFAQGRQLGQQIGLENAARRISNSPIPEGDSLDSLLSKEALRFGNISLATQLQDRHDKKQQQEFNNQLTQFKMEAEFADKYGGSEGVKKLLEEKKSQLDPNSNFGSLIHGVSSIDIPGQKASHNKIVTEELFNQYPELKKAGYNVGDRVSYSTDLEGNILGDIDSPKKGKISVKYGTDINTGEAIKIGTDEQGREVFKEPVSGVTLSTAQTAPQVAATTTAREQAKNAVNEPYKLRAEQRKVKRSDAYRGIESSLSSLDKANELLSNDPKLYRDLVDKNTGRGDAAKLNTYIQTAIRLFVQSVSGKVVTDREAQAYQAMFAPELLNTPEIAQFKLDSLREILELNKELLLDPENENIKTDMSNLIIDTKNKADELGYNNAPSKENKNSKSKTDEKTTNQNVIEVNW